MKELGYRKSLNFVLLGVLSNSWSSRNQWMEGIRSQLRIISGDECKGLCTRQGPVTGFQWKKILRRKTCAAGNTTLNKPAVGDFMVMVHHHGPHGLHGISFLSCRSLRSDAINTCSFLSSDGGGPDAVNPAFPWLFTADTHGAPFRPVESGAPPGFLKRRRERPWDWPSESRWPWPFTPFSCGPGLSGGSTPVSS